MPSMRSKPGGQVMRVAPTKEPAPAMHEGKLEL